MGDATLDHGAQFFTTHTDEFAAAVADWQAAGLAQPWFRGRLGPHGIVDAHGHTRFRGAESMNAVAKHLRGSTCEPAQQPPPSAAPTLSSTNTSKTPSTETDPIVRHQEG